MGIKQSKELYVQSPKENCQIKPFPVFKTKPIPIKKTIKESISLPNSFELKDKTIKNN